ncbi:hypothetical protein D3C77_654360 [compost metagenome]
MIILQGAVLQLRQPGHIGHQQLVLLHLERPHAKTSGALDSDAEQAVVLLLEIANNRLTADLRKACGRGANLLTLENAHHPEAATLLHDAADHVEIACFKDLQIKEASWE